MQERAFVGIGGCVFALVSILHLVRLIFDVTIMMGTYTLPMWVSGGGFVGAGMLASWAGFMLFLKMDGDT